MARIEYVRGHNDAVEMLTSLKLIVSIPYRGGYLVGRYGVNKRALVSVSKKLEGE